MEEQKLYGCGECGAQIDDDEFVTNWGSCAPCFDSHYDVYVRKDKRKRFLQKASAWVLAAVIATALFAGAGKVIGIVLYRMSQVN